MRVARIMVSAPLLLGFGLAVSPAWAALPLFNARCPGGLEVHADAGGPVYVNGREAQLRRVNDDYYEAGDRSSGVTLSIRRGADDVQVSYTGPGNASGVCQVAGNTGAGRAAPASRAPAPPPEAAPAESDLLGACNVRAGAPGRLVTRVPVGSDAAELVIDYPDGRFVCMVRNDGFVTSLTRIRAR